LKRRCVYHWIDYPSVEQATQIVRSRVPGASAALTAQVSESVARLRTLEVQKPPGIAEAIDWVRAAAILGLTELTSESLERTLGSVLKYREDYEVAQEKGFQWVVGG